MSDEMTPEEVREYRVWCENGDYIAGATITYGYVTGMHWVTPNPYRTGDSTKEVDFQTRHSAFRYARQLCERYMAEAVANATEQLGEAPTGVLSEHGYSIQVCEDGQDITGHVYDDM